MEESMKSNFLEESSDFSSKFKKNNEEGINKNDFFKGQGISLTSTATCI